MVAVPAGVRLFEYTWEQFDADVERIARAVESSGRKFSHIYGLPRGGLTLAVALSHRLGIPLFESLNPEKVINRMYVSGVLVVDDLSDTGEQLSKFRGQIGDQELSFFIATIHKKPWTKVVPDIWLHETTDWVVYPWEKSRGR